jgi:hypothetical protein
MRRPGCPGLSRRIDFHPKINRVDPDAFYELPPSRSFGAWWRGSALTQNNPPTRMGHPAAYVARNLQPPKPLVEEGR